MLMVHFFLNVGNIHRNMDTQLTFKDCLNKVRFILANLKTANNPKVDIRESQ